MIEVTHKNLGEIRMGSPFNLYEVTLKGEWIPDIDEDGWQEAHVRSPDGRHLVLTAWDTTNNEPGFVLYLIDSVKRSYVRTDTFCGCCTKLQWQDDGIYWEAWHETGDRNGKMPLPAD